MALSDTELERYARHIIVPGIGATGQEALMKTEVQVRGDSSALSTACEYFRRSGVGSHTGNRGAVVTVGNSLLDSPHSEQARSTFDLQNYSGPRGKMQKSQTLPTADGAAADLLEKCRGAELAADVLLHIAHNAHVTAPTKAHSTDAH